MRCLLSLVILFALAANANAQNPREKKVRDDKAKVEADGYWIYNDLPKAWAESKETGKPMIVILRCIPCEECVKLDDDLVDMNPLVRPLLDKFVRVRVVSTNGLDLSLFQYDYDQSFACFLLNADGTIYGRFGTRSHRTNWLQDVSIEGLQKALEGGLELHTAYPKNKAALAGKRGPEPIVPVPEKFPTLGKYTNQLNYEGNVVQSCIHCHQVGDAMKDYYRRKREPLPEDVLFPYPHPKSLGLILDPKERATVKEVTPNTPAAKAGFKPGDVIRAMNGQPLISMADVQWVLHRTPADGGKIDAYVFRDGKAMNLSLVLAKGWRQADDISWRSSSWGLRRMGTAGMKLDPVEERPAAAKDGMALSVKHVGMFGGPHGAAKAAGIQVGDILVSFDGRTDLLRETDVFAYAMREKKPGDSVIVKVLRGGKTLEMKIPMQE
jgi:hypothetical protein